MKTIPASRRDRVAKSASDAEAVIGHKAGNGVKRAIGPKSVNGVTRAIGAKSARLGKLDFKPLAFLAENGIGRTMIELKKGDHVFSQGTTSNAVFYVQEGKIKLSVVSKAGKEATIALLGPGNFLGEECIAALKMMRVSSATAIEPSTVLRIERAEMIRVLHAEKEFSAMFVAYLLARNARVQEDLVDQLFNSSEKRLARALLLLAQFGKDDTKPETVIPKISQEVLAEMVGTTRSRVNFFMNRFRQMGFIEYNGHLTIHTSLLNVILHD